MAERWKDGVNWIMTGRIKEQRVKCPEVVIFDLGKVLVDFDFTRFARQIEPHCDWSAERIMAEIVNDPMLVEYESGHVDSETFFERVQKRVGYRESYETFGRQFGEIFTELAEMGELQARVKAAGIPIYAFSNTNELAIRILKRYAFWPRFEDVVLSFEHGGLKPEAKLYDVVEQRVGRKGDALLFIDDRAENIEAARERGWHGIVHTTHQATEAGLRAVGLEF